jgi:hypothetical protein
VKAESGFFRLCPSACAGPDPGFIGLAKLRVSKKAQSDSIMILANEQARYLAYFDALKNLKESCYAEFIHRYPSL